MALAPDNQPYDYFLSAPVNNGGLDPVSGYDIEVWVQDTVTGKVAIFGRFQTITMSIRDATETYISLGERMPTYLNGEIQIAWVLEQGLIDMNFLNRSFGVSEMTRAGRIGRGPRFHISFDVNADELDYWSKDVNSNPDKERQQRAGVSNDSNNLQFSSGGDIYGTRSGTGGDGDQFPGRRRARGRIELQRCKIDSLSMGAMSGRRVAALRWEGVAEGYRTVQSTVQNYKSKRAQVANEAAGTGGYQPYTFDDITDTAKKNG